MWLVHQLMQMQIVSLLVLPALSIEYKSGAECSFARNEAEDTFIDEDQVFDGVAMLQHRQDVFQSPPIGAVGAAKPQLHIDSSDVSKHTEQEAKGQLLYAGNLLCTIILAFTIFAMTRASTPNVATCTWLALDNCISVFLAMLWFHVVQGITSALLSPMTRLIALFLHALALLLLTCAGAWYWRGSKAMLNGICGCAVYWVAFAWACTAIEVQKSLLPFASAFWATLILTMLLLFLVAASLYYAKRWLGLRHADGVDGDNPDHCPIWARRMPICNAAKSEDALSSEDPCAVDWAERIESIENEAGALTLAVLWTKLACFLLSVELPLFTGSLISGTRALLIYSCWLLLMVGLFMMTLGKALVGTSLKYFPRRASHFLCSFLIMSTAWAFIEWSQQEIVHRWSDIPVWLSLWLVSLLWVIVMIVRIFFLAHGIKSPVDLKVRFISLRAVALMVGWSLEQSLNTALHVKVEGWPNAHVLQVVGAFTLGVCIMPIYIMYFKPITIDIDGL